MEKENGLEIEKKSEITFVEEVDFAGAIQDFATLSVDVEFKNDSVKEVLFGTKKDELIKVVEEIGSKVKIVSITPFNEELLTKDF